MAAEGPSGPNIDTNLAYRMSQAQGQGGAGFSPLLFLMGLFGHGRTEVNVTQQLSSQGKGFNCDKTMPLPKAQPAMWEKLLESTGLNRKAISEGLAKCHYTPSQSSTESITGVNHGLGGGSRGGGHGVGE